MPYREMLYVLIKCESPGGLRRAVSRIDLKAMC